jgi:hypothetical protein
MAHLRYLGRGSLAERYAVNAPQVAILGFGSGRTYCDSQDDRSLVQFARLVVAGSAQANRNALPIPLLLHAVGTFSAAIST